MYCHHPALRGCKTFWLKYPARDLYFHHARRTCWSSSFILYFGLPYVGVQLPALFVLLLVSSCVSAAYMVEIFRSSIVAVDR